MPIYQLDPLQLAQLIDAVTFWGTFITGLLCSVIVAVTWKG